MSSTDAIFSKLKNWWIIWTAFTVLACWCYRLFALEGSTSPNGVPVVCKDGSPVGIPGFISTIGHSLTIAGAVLVIWSLARLAAGIRVGLARARSQDLLLMIVIEAVLSVSLMQTLDRLCVLALK